MRFKFWQRPPAELPSQLEPVRLDWLEIAQTTVHQRQFFEFVRLGAAEEMAAAAEAAFLKGGQRAAINAMIAVYERYAIYSTPHEYPCDEWNPRDIQKPIWLT